jgi:hypothetical protein
MSTSKAFLAAALAIAAAPAWPQSSTEADACAAVACREAAVRRGLELRFWQEKDGSSMLTVKNNLGRRIAYEAAMQLPTEARMRPTSVLPIEAGLTNYESWPHPVAQLVLFNIHYEDK